MHKSSFLIMTVLNLVFVALMAKVFQIIKNQVPVGYEDETGFHYGSK
jgi:hypothetical protein